jgi:hypothetical protein
VKDESGSKPKTTILAVNVPKDASEAPARVKDAIGETEGQG